MSTVSIRKTEKDDYEGIKAAVFNALEDLGGIEDIIKPGYKVLVNPNFVAVPTSRLSGAVTRWEVCKAVCEAVKALGAHPVIAESASVGSDTEDVILFCGYNSLREEGIEVIDLKGPDSKPCVLGTREGRENSLFPSLNSWELVRDADAIISVPVMKVHDQLGISCALKNLKGLIADKDKRSFHRRGVIEGLCDMLCTLKPVLTVVDGTYCLEGIGPVFGETKKMDLILASKDLVACDAVCAELMDFPPGSVPLTEAAAKCGLGQCDLSKIQIKGEAIERLKTHFMRTEETSLDWLPEGMALICDPKACTGCKNTVIEFLIQMRDEGVLEGLKGYTLVTGPADPDHFGFDPEDPKVYYAGNCAMKASGRPLLTEEGKLPDCAESGCPPLVLNRLVRIAEENLAAKHAAEK